MKPFSKVLLNTFFWRSCCVNKVLDKGQKVCFLARHNFRALCTCVWEAYPHLLQKERKNVHWQLVATLENIVQHNPNVICAERSGKCDKGRKLVGLCCPPAAFCDWRSFLCIVHYDWTATKVPYSPNMWERKVAQREKDGTRGRWKRRSLAMRLGNAKTFHFSTLLFGFFKSHSTF